MNDSKARMRLGIAGLVATGLALACDAPPLAPDEVAKSFWEAMHADQIETAAEFASAATITQLPDLDVPRAENLLFGEVLKNQSAAVVRTSMSTADEDVSLNVVFNTHLVLEEDEWKVDVAATRDEMVRATFAAGMRMVGEAIGAGFEELGEALEEGAEEVREALIEALQESKRDDP
jgi:hypothetical protein